jgi:xanthine/CO dehydrogenase XdhC/CoxF family maturation factor
MFLRVATLIAVTLVSAAVGTASPAAAVMHCSKDYYKAVSGDCVHKPVCTPSRPPGATGQCADGCFTFSEDPDDEHACHGRGGLQKSF